MATAPIDYTFDAGNPADSIMKGYLQGSQIMAMQQQRQQEQAAAQAKAAQQAQMQTDFQAVAGNPNSTGADYARLMTLYPQLSEGIKRGWDALNEQQKQVKLDQTGQIFSALRSGKSDIAKNYLQDIIDSSTNSGDTRQATMATGLMKQIDSDPQSALASTQMMLVSQLGPEKFAQAFGQVGAEQRAQALAPAELRTANAKAGTAESEQAVKAVEAKYADSNAAQDLAKKGWDIKKIMEDINIAKEGNRISAMNAQTGRINSDTQRQELGLKIQEAKDKREQMIRDKVSSAESAASSIDNLSNTVDRILKNPSLESVIGSIQGRMPSVLSNEGADAIALIEQLGSQAFIAQIPQMKGTGSLSEKEGDKLQASLQNLSRVQGEKQFRYNLEEVQRLMGKARERLSKSTGMPLSAPDRPNAPARTENAGPAAPGAPASQQRNVVVDF